MPLWKCCMDFLNRHSKSNAKSVNLRPYCQNRHTVSNKALLNVGFRPSLIIKKDDFALYSGDSYVPFINKKDVLDLLYRNPNGLSVKSFSVEALSGVSTSIVRVNLDKSELNGNTFIETIRRSSFYRQLNIYAQTTKDISSEAKKFRDVIAQATDPETTFFEHLPEALGFREVVLTQNPKQLTVSYPSCNAIRNLRSC